jgi:hypothetical protein
VRNITGYAQPRTPAPASEGASSRQRCERSSAPQPGTGPAPQQTLKLGASLVDRVAGSMGEVGKAGIRLWWRLMGSPQIKRRPKARHRGCVGTRGGSGGKVDAKAAHKITNVAPEISTLPFSRAAHLRFFLDMGVLASCIGLRWELRLNQKYELCKAHQYQYLPKQYDQ